MKFTKFTRVTSSLAILKEARYNIKGYFPTWSSCTQQYSKVVNQVQNVANQVLESCQLGPGVHSSTPIFPQFGPLFTEKLRISYFTQHKAIYIQCTKFVVIFEAYFVSCTCSRFHPNCSSRVHGTRVPVLKCYVTPKYIY